MPTNSISAEQPELNALHSREARFLLPLLLLFSAVFATISAAVRPIDNDEFMAYHTDLAPTFADVFHVQLHWPIGLEPPTSHLITHLSMDLFGSGHIAVRLPAILGFLVLQLCLFVFVHRLAGTRPALLAAAFPFCTQTFAFASQDRPYGILIVMSALSMLCWQTATRYGEAGCPRLLALLGLALALSGAITDHFFGVLLLFPTGIAELVRIVRRRRVDWPVVAAFAVGIASIAIDIPFANAIKVFRSHYFQPYEVGVKLQVIPETYRQLLFLNSGWSRSMRHVSDLVVVALLFSIAWLYFRESRRVLPQRPVWESVAILLLFLLPVFGYLLGHYITRTMMERYVMGTLFAIAVVFGLAFSAVVRRTAAFYAIFGLLLVGGMALSVAYSRQAHAQRQALLAGFVASPEVAAELAKNPNEPIYVQSITDFYLDTHYGPVDLRPRFHLLYGQPEEIQWVHHDTLYLTACNMRHFTSLPMETYANFLGRSHPLLINYHRGWEWTDGELNSRHMQTTPVGAYAGGDLVRVDTAGQTATAVPCPQ